VDFTFTPVYAFVAGCLAQAHLHLLALVAVNSVLCEVALSNSARSLTVTHVRDIVFCVCV